MTLRLGNKKVCPTKLVKVNNVDWNKAGYVFGKYATDGTYDKILSGKVYAANGVYPRATADETGTTKFVNFSQPFEINFEFTAPTITSHNHVLFGNGYYNQYFRSPACEYQANISNVTFWAGLSTSGTTWDYGLSFTPEEIPKVAGDIYNVNYKYDGSKFILSVTHNNITLTKSVAVTGTPYYSTHESRDGTYLSFGKNAGNGGTPLEGYFHAWNTYIKQNGVFVWGCEKGQDYIEVDPNNYLISNVTKVGAVEDDRGILSNFTINNYAKNNPLPISANKDLSVVIKFKTGNEVSSIYVILDWMYQTNAADSALRFYINNGKLRWIVKTSDDTYIIDNFEGSSIIANTTYYAKFDWDSTNNLWTCSISTDGTNWTTDITARGGMIGNIVQIDWGRWYTSNYVFNGSIDLNECYVTSGGQTVWQGVVPQGSRG